jgi:crotonobetaine/carnitine-CoA ligase
MWEQGGRLHQPQEWVVGRVLDRQASRNPEKVCIRVVDGPDLTFAGADLVSRQVAQLLGSVGILPGDRVAVMLPNGMDHCLVWFGASRAGAVLVSVNTEYKGRFLTHVLNNSRARVLVVQDCYLDAVRAVEDEVPELETLLVCGDDRGGGFRLLETLPFDRYSAQDGLEPIAEVSYRDDACIMYTSGTTGPSKGVLMPHAHLYLFGLGTIEHLGVGPNDVFYVVLPMFHANALFMQIYACLIAGATAVVRDRFSASAWLQDVRRYGATLTNSLGAVTAFVLEQPPSEHDRDHRLRAIGCAPNPPELERGLRERFGIAEVIGAYGMTEINIPLYTERGSPRPGSCGREWSRYYEVRIVDPETDEPVASKETGEIVVRPRQPFGFMSGYNGMPEKTVEAWRNFWFHTGDAAWMDEEGYVYFVDRIKDCIRRRGENISSYEIECVVLQHPAVEEVAAVAVPSEVTGAEDEVKVVIVLRSGACVDPEQLMAYCEPLMPSFAVPRFVEFRDALPKTPTAKVQKHKLRRSGIRGHTWDRLATRQ